MSFTDKLVDVAQSPQRTARRFVHENMGSLESRDGRALPKCEPEVSSLPCHRLTDIEQSMCLAADHSLMGSCGRGEVRVD